MRLGALLIVLAFCVSCPGCIPIIAGAAAGSAAGTRATRDATVRAEECLAAHPDWSRLVCTHLAYSRAAVGMTDAQLAALDMHVFERRPVGDVERVFFERDRRWWADLRDGIVVDCHGPRVFCAPPLPR